AALALATDSQELERYSNLRAAQWGQDLWQSTLGSLIIGGAAATPQAAWQYSAEQGAYAQQQLKGFAEAREQTKLYRERVASGALSPQAIAAGNSWLQDAPATPRPAITPPYADNRLPASDPNMAAQAEEAAAREAQALAAATPVP